MHQLQVGTGPHPLEPRSHLPPHPSPLGGHRAPWLEADSKCPLAVSFAHCPVYVSVLLSGFVPPYPSPRRSCSLHLHLHGCPTSRSVHATFQIPSWSPVAFQFLAFSHEASLCVEIPPLAFSGSLTTTLTGTLSLSVSLSELDWGLFVSDWKLLPGRYHFLLSRVAPASCWEPLVRSKNTLCVYFDDLFCSVLAELSWTPTFFFFFFYNPVIFLGGGWGVKIERRTCVRHYNHACAKKF